MKHALSELENDEECRDASTKAHRDIQQKIDDAKAVAQRRETFLLSRSSLFGATKGPHAFIGESDEEYSESEQQDSMGNIASASIIHLLPEEQRQKESKRIRKEHKKLLKNDKNIDIHINDVFKEKNRNAVATIIDSIGEVEENEKSDIERARRNAQKKCVIS